MSQETQSHRSGRGGTQLPVTPKQIIAIVLFILAAVFVVQNSDHVDITIYFWDVHIRQVWALLVVFLIGALLGWMVPRLRSRRQ